RSLEMVVGILGTLTAGGAYVPLEVSYPPERMRYMLQDAGVAVVLTTGQHAAQVSGGEYKVVRLDEQWEQVARESAERFDSEVMRENLAYVIYTSGSTGKPKGVMITHASVIRLFESTQSWSKFDEHDVWSLFHSCAFDFSVWEFFGALLFGGRLIVVPTEVTRDPRAFYELLQTEHVTVLNQTPSAFRQLMRVDQSSENTAPLDLRLVVFGGEKLEIKSIKPWFTRHGDECPRLVNMYGITETTVHVTSHNLKADDTDGAASLIGQPIADLQTYVLDQFMQLVPVGVAGEIYVGGEGLARGYLNRASLTAERFLPNPFTTRPGARLYRSGDRARYLPDGTLEYLGRVDKQIKIRGFRIELGEIEAALRLHHAVEDVVLILREDEQLNNSVAAYIVIKPEQVLPSIDELRDFLLRKLPEYMVPAHFAFLPELPLTANGKVDRLALPDIGAQRPKMDHDYVAPRNPVEKELAQIWAQALGIDRVGINDNFFSLGGDSIRSIQIRAKAQSAKLNFSLQQLFENPTVAGLATVIATNEVITESAPKIDPFSLITEEDRRSLPNGLVDAYPMTELQKGMLFHSSFDQSSAIYHNVTSLRLRAPLYLKELRAAAAELIARHAVLRTSFNLTNFSEPLQLVHRTVELPFEVEDLSELSANAQNEFLDSWFEAEKKLPFDWKDAPLIRFQVHILSNDTFQFAFTEHHAILDGWSVATMLTELFSDYFNRLNGTEQVVDAPTLEFRDYVAMERQALASEEIADYWSERLKQSQAIKLPRSRDQVQDSRRRGRAFEVDLSPDLSAGLQTLSHDAGVPLKSVLLAAHLYVLSVLGNQSDVMTGVETNGRPEATDAQRVLGLFLNILPFRQKLTGGTWIELAQRVFQAELEMLPFRRYPVSKLQRTQDGTFLFETMFNFTHFHVYEDLPFLQRDYLLGAKTFAETNFVLEANFYLDSADSSQIGLRLSYDSATLGDEQIEVIGDYYRAALTAMASDPASHYERHDLLSVSERQQLLEEWNDTEKTPETAQSLGELFAEQAARTPAAVAVSYDGAELSYEELAGRVNQLARHLRSLGVGPEVRVGILLDRSLEMVVGILGTLTAGGAYVPLEVSYPPERVRYMLQDAGVAVVLTTGQHAAQVNGDEYQVVRLDEQWEQVAQESA
ncbi:MAG TPA: amino acid adenylation domain-containing protein, partial [Pyrinomonadaceae bacterium]